jgi:copper chaperone
MRKAVTIEGMTCQHCVRHVTEALQELKGVKNVEVNLSTGRALIETEVELLDSEIREAIDEVGYEVTGIQEA